MDVVGLHKILPFSPYLETMIECLPLLYKMLVINSPLKPLEIET